MKQIKFLVAALSVSTLLYSCTGGNKQNLFNFPVENNVQEDGHGEHGGHDEHGAATEEKATGSFGAKIDEHGAMAAADLLKQLQSKDSVAGKVTAPITAACQKKGCWMMVDLGGTEMRVTFKDYAFFVPKNSAGRTATIEGVAHKEEISVATLKHYAEDEGKTKAEIAAITKPETEYSFEATGVIIK